MSSQKCVFLAIENISTSSPTKKAKMKALNNLVLRRTSTYFAGIALSVFFFERGFDLATDSFFRSYNKGKLWDDIKDKYEQ